MLRKCLNSQVARYHDKNSMWKTQLNRAVQELRFVLKPGREHHGTW